MPKKLTEGNILSIIGKIKKLINGKQDTLVSQTNIKSINGESVLGEGDIEISGTNTYNKYVVVAVAGQSNAVGYDETAVSGVEYKVKNNNRIKQIGLWNDDTLELIDLDYCAHSIQNMSVYGTNGTKGVHLPLANLLLDYIPEDYGVIILPVSYGATGFTGTIGANLGTYDAEKMRPTSLTTQLSWRVNGAYYQTLVNRIKYAMDLNEDNIFGGVVWIQGENDAQDPSNALTYFKEMTSQFFSDLSSYASRTITGKMDKSIWFNVETTNYWYTDYQYASGCSQIWDGYKTWSPSTYVALPSDTKTNLVGSTKNTNRVSSTYPSHFGENAYEDTIAPAIVKVMSSAYAQKVKCVQDVSTAGVSVDNVTETQTHFDGSYLTTDKLNNQDKNATLASVIDGTIKFNSDIEGTGAGWNWTDHKPYVMFTDATAIEFEVTHGVYWLMTEYGSDNGYTLMGLGYGKKDGFDMNISGQITNMDGSKFAKSQAAQASLAKIFAEGDSLLVTNDGDIVHIYHKSKDGDYSLWMSLQQPKNYGNSVLGLAYGISGGEYAVGSDNTILAKNVKVGTIDDIVIGTDSSKFVVEGLKASKYLTIKSDGTVTLTSEFIKALTDKGIVF